MVLVRPWVSHLQLLWEGHEFRSFFERLAQHLLLVRYDGRGNGLSQRDVTGITFDDLVLDLETVADRLDLRDMVLFGDTFGGPVAIAYIARHPQRVSHLILHGAYARASDFTTPEQAAAIIALVRTLPDAAKRVLTHYTHPGADAAPHRMVPMGEIISSAVASKLYTIAFEMDVSALLDKITVPTLILQRRSDASTPFRAALDLASRIPNARLVPLQGREHNCWEGDSAAALRAIGEFLGLKLQLAPEGRAEETRLPLIILFTDMQSSTALTQRLGDAKAQEVLRAHNTIVRDALQAHGGAEIKHTGDGIMASFPSASRAIECAIAIQSACAERNAGVGAGSKPAPTPTPDPIRVRIGLNAGEPVAEEQDLFGAAVQLAARICAQAEAGEILVSDVVKGLVAGKGFLFADRGETALRGFEDPVRLYQVRWEP